MRKILDYLVMKPKMEPACRAAGKHTKWIWAALRRSADGDPDYLLSWQEGDPPEQFCDLIMKARRMWRVNFDAGLRETVALDEIPVIVNGKQMWVEDPKLLAEWSNAEDAERIGGIKDFPYKHDATGARIPLMMPIASAAALKIHGARSMLGEAGWNPSDQKNVDVHVGGQVMIVGTRARPAASYAKDAPPVETPLRRDLAQRLADLRANGPAHKHPLDEHGNRTMPNAPEGREKPGDPPEQTGEVVKPQIRSINTRAPTTHRASAWELENHLEAVTA